MGNDNRPEIVLDGDISPFRQKMREAANQLKQLGSDGEQAVGRLTGPLNALQSKFVAIGALLAGGAVFKEAIDQTTQLTEESTKLGRALGISTGEASILREALVMGNTSQEDFMAAAKGMSKELTNNEAGLQAMGLKTRDAAGQLRPLNDLVLEGIGVVNGYRAGTDRAIAGQAMFGKGFEMTGNLANMNKQAIADTAQQMRELGIVASEESVAAWKAFDDAGDSAGLTLKALKITIGNAVLPVLTRLGEWFSAIGPAAVVVIRGAIGGLVALFWGLKTAAGAAFELINAAVVTVAEPIRAVSVAFWKLIQGDFEGAKAEIANIPKVWSQAWSGSFDNIVKDATEARDKMWNLFAEGTPTAKPGAGGKSATGLLKDDKKDKADKSHMAEYEAQLAAKKNLYEQENLLRQFSKEQELAYWRELLNGKTLTENDRLAIAKRAATLELDIRRQNAKEQRDIDAAMVDSRRAAVLAQIQLEEQQATFARENGALTQRELIAQQEELAARRFEIEYQSLMQRMELVRNDPNTSPAELLRIKEQMLEVERQYVLRRGELQQQAVVESQTTWRSFTDTISGLWDKGIQALMNGTFTWRNAFRAVGAELTSWFATEVVGKQVKEWVSGQARMLAVKLGLMQAEKAVEAASAATTVATKTAETTAVVSANAAQAGSGAAASQAPIPIVGPMLALAAMATVFAAVMALSSRKSAMGGYDIPRGLNPVTQLHEEEMVLPQKYANVIRGMAGGQGGQSESVGGGHTINISAIDARSFQRFLGDNASALPPALQKLARQFVKVPR